MGYSVRQSGAGEGARGHEGGVVPEGFLFQAQREGFWAMRSHKELEAPNTASEKGLEQSGQSCAPAPDGPIAGDPMPGGMDKRGALVESVVLQLNNLCKHATFDFAMAVGKLIIDTIYSGELGAWRSRGVKSASFRKLAKHPDLPMSPSALYRSVAIYELGRRLGVDRWQFVSTSHLRLLLPLPGDRQRQLVQAAEAHAWSVQRLREEIAALDAESARPRARGGRSKQSRLRKTIGILQKCVDSSSSLMETDEDGELSPETARSVAELAQRLREACAKLENRARRYIPGAQTEPPPPLGGSARAEPSAEHFDGPPSSLGRS